MLNYFNNSQNSLLEEFRRFEHEMNQLFHASPKYRASRSVAQHHQPPVNLSSTDEQVDIYLFAPALDLEKLDISIQRNKLTIRGTRKQEERPDDTKTHLKERDFGDFERLFTLPEDLDQEKIDASYRDGVLHITVCRKESSKPRQITIN